jgi:hypothetical protein
VNARDRRALTAGLLVCVAAVLLLRGLPWSVRTAAAARERLQARASLVARSEEDLQLVPVLEDSARALRGRLAELAPKILTGAREAEARSDLAERLSVAAEAQRVRVARTDAVPDSAHAGQLRRVSIEAELEGDTAGMLGLLSALCRGPALLWVADLRVVAVNPTSPETAPEVLHTELTLRGWYLQGGRGP